MTFGEAWPVILTATTALPYPHLERATAGLRGQLRLGLAHGELADWSTLVVTGPTPATDTLGRRWFEYQGTVSSDAGPVGTGPPRLSDSE